jgi:hypothetical protein
LKVIIKELGGKVIEQGVRLVRKCEAAEEQA